MFLLNTHALHGQPLEAVDAEPLGRQGALQAQRFFQGLAQFQPSPLRSLADLARANGLAALHVKDESDRLGLQSFKALGGLYAVMRLVLEQAERALGRTLAPADLQLPEVRAVAAAMTFGCATDGNHGRSVAAGAQRVGARAQIFVHAGVSAQRVTAIARLGAQIVRVPGCYDDAVAQATQVCAQQGWHLLSDTAWQGYERVPAIVMQGYTVLMHEALAQLPQAPTHVFVQAGVGGLAAALAAYLHMALGAQRPKLVVVEPRRAACVFESARAGRLVQLTPGEPTLMSMLECFTPSSVAWRILVRTADAFVTVDEDDAVAAMRQLAWPQAADPAIVAGESGAAGLAGLLRVAGDAGLRAQLGLGPQARVLVINTEGATDPARYRDLLGPEPQGPQERPLYSTATLKGLT